MTQLEKRAKEASRLGLKRMLVPAGNKPDIAPSDLDVVAVETLAQAVSDLCE